MTFPLRITFRGLHPSDAIDSYVRKRAAKLDDAGARIVTCDVAVEAPHKHKRHGGHFRVRIDLVVPGRELVVDRNPDVGRAHEDVYASIDDAFDHAVRSLHDETHKRRRRS